MINTSLLQKRYGSAAPFLLRYRQANDTMPWVAARHRIRSRCAGYTPRDRRAYQNRKFKVEVSSAELKDLFFRDKAWAMAHPSLDRIDPDKGYFKENLRWTPMSENRRERGMRHPCREPKYQKGAKLLDDFFSSLGWPRYLQRMFLFRYREDRGLNITDRHR